MNWKLAALGCVAAVCAFGQKHTHGIINDSGVADFGASSSFKIRVAAGATATTNGFLVYDSTNHMIHAAQSSADAMIPQFTITPVNNDCVKWVVSGSNYKLGSAGAACGSGSGITALTGDVTASGTGSVTATLANIPTATPMAGSLLVTAIAAPSTPASGKGSFYLDSTSKNFALKNDAGTINHGIQTRNCGSDFVSAIADDGSTTCTPALGGGGTGVGRTSSNVAFSSSIPDGSCADNTFTWTGVTTSDTVIPGWPSSLATGILGQMYVSAADTVKIRLCNLSGSANTPGTLTYKATLAIYNLSGSSSINFSAIADGACAVNTFTLTGVAAADPVTPKWPSGLETGLAGIMRASATDTVEVRLCNLSGASLDPANATFGASVAK